jgi:hypothetical protein
MRKRIVERRTFKIVPNGVTKDFEIIDVRNGRTLARCRHAATAAKVLDGMRLYERRTATLPRG